MSSETSHLHGPAQLHGPIPSTVILLLSQRVTMSPDPFSVKWTSSVTWSNPFKGDPPPHSVSIHEFRPMLSYMEQLSYMDKPL